MIEHWWPTEIGFYDNPDHDKLDLIDYCYEIQSKTESGGEYWISSDTYNTSTHKFSPHKDEKFKKLDDWISKQVQTYIQETDINYQYSKSFTASWFNIYKTGDYQEIHQHHGNILSAVYFLKSNPDFSPILFFSNFSDMHNIGKKNGVGVNNPIRYKAIPGRLIIFRSYVPHCVEKHKDTEDRISIAYNFG